MHPTPLAEHPFFTPWTDPVSGVTSYVLQHRESALQKAWYFTRPCLLNDQHYLGFFANNAPQRDFYPALVSLSPEIPEIISYPHLRGSGLFDPEDRNIIYFPVDDMIIRQPIHGSAEILARLPASLLKNRHLFLLSTNLTLTADHRYFILDSHIGNRWLISLVERTTGEWTPLKWFSNRHHHAIAAPHDPTLFLISQGHWTDAITGDKQEMDLRIWLMTTDQTLYQPLDPKLWFNRTAKACHEWWSPDGQVQYCDYDHGIFSQDPLDPSSRRLIWAHPSIHGQVDPSGRYLVADEGCYHWNERRPCRVFFFDRESQREIAVVNEMPPQPLPWSDFRTYHIDPHPQFSADGRYVIYTTTALGMPSVALCPVDELLRSLPQKGQTCLPSQQ